MEQQKGLTLVGVIVTVIVILFIIGIFMPALGKVRPAAQRIVCRTNLKGLGCAITVYADDYNDKYPQLPGKGSWSKSLGFAYDLKKPDFKGAQLETPRTITASWYLLVREADVSPKSFVCMSSDQLEYDGKNPNGLDLVQLWDFGDNPYKHVSYACHNPYGKYPSGGWLPASFAVAADMSPWFQDGDILPPNNDTKLPPQIVESLNLDTFNKGNSLNHTGYKDSFLFIKYTRHSTCGFGQNILWADGHSSFKKQPNVGVNNDNIYTFWSTEENPTEQDRQGGTAPTSRSPENDAKSKDDSFLAI